MTDLKNVKNVEELSDQDRNLLRAFLDAAGPGEDRFQKAARSVGVPIGILRQLDRLDSGEDEDPDDLVIRLVQSVDGMPSPPEELLDKKDKRLLFVPAPEMTAWMIATFVSRDGPLTNKEHKHLVYAPPAVLWTNVGNKRGGSMVAGTASMPANAKGDQWVIAQRQRQLIDWFGKVPDFLITLDARYWAQSGNGTRLALSEHEMCHCGQKKDKWKQPMFSRETGRPLFCLRGHDVEVFVTEWERYGAECSAGESVRLLEVGKRGPSVTKAQIEKAVGKVLPIPCGSCR